MRNEQTEADLAALSIPGPDKAAAALAWRLKLIRKEGIFPYSELLNVIRAASKNTVDQNTKARLVRIANSEEMLVDEVEQTKLFVTTLLLRAGTVSAKALLSLDRNTRIYAGSKSIEQFSIENPDHIKQTRKRLLSWGQKYLSRDISKIRAKIAFQEIVTALVPNEMVPVMISISPKYLGCPFIQKWIKVHQFHAQHGKSANRQESRKQLRSLAKALQGDPRSIRKRQYPYWSLHHKYEDLTGWIKGFRERFRKGELDSEFFELFLSERKIPPIYRDLILKSKYSANQIALDIMADRGEISDTKAFKNFQPKVSKLRKKHYGSEISLVVEDFLDMPSNSPEVLLSIDHLSVLEQVRL